MQMSSEGITSSKFARSAAPRLGLFHKDTACPCASEQPQEGPDRSFSHGGLPAGLSVQLALWARGEPGRSHAVAGTVVDGVFAEATLPRTRTKAY